MNPVILLVEDEPAIADTLAWTLKNEGFAPCHVSTGAAALERLAQGGVAVAVLDVGLPDLSGFEVCRRIRTQDAALPVMFLTARSEEIDRVLGFEIGADDYVAKPFSPREVVARLRVMLRRTGALAAPTQLSPGLLLDEAGARVLHANAPLPLTRYEYLLLRHLLKQPGRIFSRDQLLDAVWGQDSESTDRTVDTHIKTLRAKLRAVAPELDPIQTHRGMGYSLVAG
ncbi:two-component system response regulator CreB [Uliginosibacterium sp. 31-16]|uniref:two-component system response regulator CreB n=1 Tax=Uliginosibacterium sp. 31-16 TaxID=3068315 RepID=UPI00273D60AD|nr:two-component system response regulator CreB [Uliginosibacterium sp. 31-16]MDP5238763.1 two-component system response regulator CreB [Uliginosibacterium sp. 31-16]